MSLYILIATILEFGGFYKGLEWMLISLSKINPLASATCLYFLMSYLTLAVIFGSI